MDIRPGEITDILKREIKEYDREIDVAETGTVLSIGDGIARVYGLDKVMAGELVDFGHDLFGLALNLEQDQVGVVLLGESQHVEEGQEVRRTKRIIQVPVGPALVGRVVDALGRPIDDKGPIKSTESYPIERIAPVLKAAKALGLATIAALPFAQESSDDDLQAAARELGTTIFHPVCTCAMGAFDPHGRPRSAGTVLDTDCRVFGVAGLRVVDASAMPTITSGNTNAPVMLIAERAARAIME